MERPGAGLAAGPGGPAEDRLPAWEAHLLRGIMRLSMSEENVEVVRRGMVCWLGGDFDGWRTTIDPDIGWDISTHPLPDVPNHGRGRDALVTDMLAVYMSGWTDYSAEVKETVDAGDQVVLVLHETAKMRDSGVPLARDLVHVWTVCDGRATFLRVFRTKADALEAIGLSA